MLPDEIYKYSKSAVQQAYRYKAKNQGAELLNTDWTAAGNRKKVTVDTGRIRFETEFVEREAKILTVLPTMVLEPDDFELHLEVLKSGKVRCHGTGKHRITVHKADGSAKIKTVDLTKNTAAEIPLA